MLISYARRNGAAVIAMCPQRSELARLGDVLTATAIEQSTTKRLAFCDVTVRNQDDVIAGHFRGTVYRTATPHQL